MRKRSGGALLILGSVLLILGLLQTPLLYQARGVAWTVWMHTIARVFQIGPLELDSSLRDQLQNLQAQNIRLQAELHDYKQIKEQLGSPAFDSFRAIKAAVAARPVDTFHSEIILSRGGQDGVKTGAPVVIAGSTLIGFITDVHSTTSVCRLLIHPATSFAAQVQNETTNKGLLVGQNYTSILLTTVPRDVKIAIKQEVVTVSREGVPEGLRIGQITAIHNEQNEAYQEAVVNLPYDLDNIRAVNILVSP